MAGGGGSPQGTGFCRLLAGPGHGRSFGSRVNLGPGRRTGRETVREVPSLGPVVHVLQKQLAVTLADDLTAL